MIRFILAIFACLGAIVAVIHFVGNPLVACIVGGMAFVGVLSAS